MKATETDRNGNEFGYRLPMTSPKELAAWKKRKASLFHIRRLPRDDRPRPAWRRKRILYARVANASVLYVGRWEISWRMPHLLESLWAAAWDAGWRSGYHSGWVRAHEALGNKVADIPEGKPEQLGPGSTEELYHLWAAEVKAPQ